MAKKQLKVYLAGPMRGIKDLNFPVFMAAATQLRKQGHFVFNPVERDIQAHGSERLRTETGDHEEVAANLGMSGLSLARECFLNDTQFICAHADAIALLPGWKKSKGATAEHALALALGLKVIFLK